MWKYNNDWKKWYQVEDTLLKSDFDYLKQELSATRFYSKALSGSAYVAINDVNNLYDTLSAWKPRNWFLSALGSPYVYSAQPTSYKEPITQFSSYNFYTKNLKEYGLTLKNLFTPERLLNDVLKNYIQVDVATTAEIDLEVVSNSYYIDGVRLVNGHRVLVKDQKYTITLASDVDPNTILKGPYTEIENIGLVKVYEYYTERNGLYEYRNGKLNRLLDLDDYNNVVRLSIYVKTGQVNAGKQFHLKRLLNGFYPVSTASELVATGFEGEPMEFTEKHNWLLRNRVDYNNLFETNYYDILKHPNGEYAIESVTYSIPERIIAIGEFGIIVNNQNGKSNIIPCKYKVNLRSIANTEKYYWICGDDSTLLRVTKHNFEIKPIKLETYSNLKSISFLDSSRGVVVGDFNTIYITIDGGVNWKRIRFSNFDQFNYNKVIFTETKKFYVAGRGGVFIEFVEDLNTWVSYRRRISRSIDDDDEYLFIDHINDMFKTTINSWGLSYSYSTQSISSKKDLIFIAGNDGKLIAYDENDTVSSEFIYLDFDRNYGDISGLAQQKGTDNFFFSNDTGVYQFDIADFKYLGVGNTYSNTATSSVSPTLIYDKFVNKMFDYNGVDLLVAGNYAITKTATYSSPYSFSELDSTFQSKLKSKLVFMNYDMGSKLNFFTDEGDYRLPNSIYIKNNYFSDKTEFTFNNLVYGATAPSFMTQSELTWYDYWIDRQKTFEYYSSEPLSDGKKVLISKTFSGSSQPVTLTFSSNDITTDSVQISKLAPSFDFSGTQSSRYKLVGNSISAPGIEDNKIYLKEYLMVIGLTNSTSAISSNKSMKVDLGDVIRIESNDIDANFIVNRIENFTDAGKYIYMYSEFNENITKQLVTTTYSVVIKNLNKFSNGDEFLERLNNHPLGIAYNASVYNEDSILIEPKFNNFTSYYNLATQIIATSSNYIEFSTDDMLNYSIPDGTSSIPQTLYCNSNFYVDEIRIKVNIYHQKLNNLIINLVGPSGKTLNVLNGPSYSLTGVTFSNTTFTTSPTYSINSFTTPYEETIYMSLGLTVGSYSNVSNTTNFRDLLVSGNAKGDWKLSVEDTLSNNIGYLKNWSLIFKGRIVEDLKYTDGFLKFGYTPRYNLLDYLTSINKNNNLNPTFYATKEYLTLPIYRGLPFGIGSLTASTVWMDNTGLTGSSNLSKPNDNKLYFGDQFKLEWESIIIDTFVDIDLYQPSANGGAGATFSSKRMLVMDKYFDTSKNAYVIGFHKMIDFEANANGGFNGSTINIRSRRTLAEISDDLQELNNIHRRKGKEIEIYDGFSYTNYESELNFKIPTDSYVKAFLCDVDTVKNITGVIYTDYKNELAMNLTRLDKEYSIPIQNTVNVNNYLYIQCFEKHELSNGDGVILEFNGGTYSSEYLNQQYFGYHTVKQVYNQYDFMVDLPYGNDTYIGNDTGFVKYIRKDPFFNYEPVDLIDVSLNKRAKQSIQLDQENLKLSGNTYSLVNVDYNKYRFRLVDGLTFDDLIRRYQWILEAEISDAVIGLDSTNELVWYKGVWEFGRWFGGTWYSGVWKYGDWYGGVWRSKNIVDKKLSVEVDFNTQDSSKSVWFTGRWYDGVWDDGVWLNGRYYGGTWNTGYWYNGTWNDGVWNNGRFIGGIWVDGTWNNGVFNTDNEPAYWIDGEWYGGDFENGIWYNGIFEERDYPARFGTNAFNSRTATWNAGTFNNGSFYSRLDNNTPDVSKTHKYSIWKTGNWNGGNWYGGIAYNINFTSGTWYGGILEDIEIIGLNENNNSFILNGIFRFNIGDQIWLLGKFDNGLTEFADTTNPVSYTVLKCVLDEVNKLTEIYIDYNINLSPYSGKYKSVVKEATLMNSVYGQSNTITGYSGSIVGYVKNEDIDSTNLSNVRVKINVEPDTGMTQSLSNLLINLKSPNGKIINVKKLVDGGDDIYLKNTTFTGTHSANSFIYGSPLYENVYSFSGATGATGFGTYNATASSITELLTTTTKGYWEVYVKAFNGLSVKINSINLEFCYSNKIGAQLDDKIDNGFDTGLRIVSKFTNTNWKSGIWSNGIFESGLYETGIWYDGIFNGTWL